MKQYTIINIPILSFFSKDLYIDVGLYWKGVGLGYLLLLLAVCWIPAMIKVHTSFSHFIDDEAPLIVEQVPDITIVDGQASITEPQPYYIKDPDSNDVLAIIDTTGTINSLENTDAICLLTKTDVTIRKSDVQTQTFELGEIENFVLNSDRIMGWLRTIKKLFVIMIYPSALLGSYVYRIIQALIYAAIGLLFASWCRITLSYAVLLRLAVVAVTPAVIVNTALGLADIHLPYAALLYLLVTLGYLFFGIKAISETIPIQEEEEEELM